MVLLLLHCFDKTDLKLLTTFIEITTKENVIIGKNIALSVAIFAL